MAKKSPQIALRKKRERFLIVLPDQGVPHRITPDEMGISLGRDRSWNAHVDGFHRANQDYLNSLNSDVSFTASSNDISLNLKANGIVGAVPLRAPDSHKVIGG